MIDRHGCREISVLLIGTRTRAIASCRAYKRPNGFCTL